jgi:hypothetical protein
MTFTGKDLIDLGFLQGAALGTALVQVQVHVQVHVQGLQGEGLRAFVVANRPRANLDLCQKNGLGLRHA